MEDLVQSMKCDPSLKTTQEEVESWINEISAKDYHYLEGKNFSIVDSKRKMHCVIMTKIPVEIG